MGASLAELAAAIGIAPSAGWDRIVVAGICEDSRRVRPGDLFVAIPGGTHDGADYVGEAIDGGAVAVVSEGAATASVPYLQVADARFALAGLSAAFHGRPTENLFTVGVTGTDGKTTVCHWIEHLLGPDRTVVIGTLTNESRGMPAVTTPSSRVVQRIAAEARDSGMRNLVVEASSIGLEQHRLDAVDFDVGVFTSLSRDHLDLHGSMGAYARAKRRLFEGLKGTARAVINGDDPAGAEMLVGCEADPLVYGLGVGADLRGINPMFEAEGTRCILGWEGERVPTSLPHPGEHNLRNGLAAASVALVRGILLQQIAEGLRRAPTLAGRFQRFGRSDGVTAVIDFAHTPDALGRALETLRRGSGRLTVVFGCPGASDRGKRAMMGAIAGRLADRVILTSDNPKDEDPEAILDEIESGLREAGSENERVIDRAEAIAHAVGRADSGDVVLIAGKGHETYQIVGDTFVPYSDRETLEELGFVSQP